MWFVSCSFHVVSCIVVGLVPPAVFILYSCGAGSTGCFHLLRGRIGLLALIATCNRQSAVTMVVTHVYCQWSLCT